MIQPPTLGYPVPPAHGADSAYYARFLAALADDVEAMGALETLLRPFGEHVWHDEQGWARTIIARPITVGNVCDWPTRLRRVSSTLRACGGAAALGAGTYDNLNVVPAIANPEQIYTARELAPAMAAASETGALQVWIHFVHTFVEVHGQPHLSLTAAALAANTEMPVDTATEMGLPVAFRLAGAAAELFTVAVGAIELRHTPEPLTVEPGAGGDFLEAPLPGDSSPGGGNSSSGGGGGSGSESDGNSSSPWSSSQQSSSPGDSSSPSSSGSSSGSLSSSFSSSKILMPVNVDGGLAYVGWCAVEAPNQKIEAILEVTSLGSPLPDWMLDNAHPERPDWQIVSAWAPDGSLVAADIKERLVGPWVVVSTADWHTGEPNDVPVIVRVRCASKASRIPWQEETDPKRRAASLKFHAATRRHDKAQ